METSSIRPTGGSSGVSSSTTSTTPPLPPIEVVVNQPEAKSDLLDLLSKIMGIILPVVLFFGTRSLNQQQVALQSLEHTQSINEENRGRVMDRLYNLGDGSATARLAAAKSLRAYATMGRIDQVSLNGIILYLKSECDEAIFETLKQAVVTATPANNTGEKRTESQGSTDAAYGGISRNPACSKSEVLPPVADQVSLIATVAAPARYLSVGCEEHQSAEMEIPVPVQLSDGQVVKHAIASIVNTDNLASYTARVLSFDNGSAKVQFYIEGRQRELFGNCPGGGHGSLVTTFQLGPK